MRASPSSLLVLALGLSLFLAGCGGGGGGFGGPYGDVEADNQTDLYGPSRVMTEFYMAPAGTGAYSGNLLGDYAFPGEIHYVGSFYEDYYDAEAWLADSPDVLVPFFDELVLADFTNTFEVY